MSDSHARDGDRGTTEWSPQVRCRVTKPVAVNDSKTASFSYYLCFIGSRKLVSLRINLYCNSRITM